MRFARSSGSLARVGVAVALGLVSALLVAPISPPAAAAGWRLAYSDGFSSGTKPSSSCWSIYNGGYRKASMVTVQAGMLTIRTGLDPMSGGWASGGVSGARCTTHTYGKYLIRARASAGDSRVNALLWPTNGWPPEVDFYEMGGAGDQGARAVVTQTVHYGTRTNHGMIHSKYPCSCTSWHVVGVEWSPGRIAYTYDGKMMRVITSHVPAEPMWLALQTAPAGHPPTLPVSFDIDWVQVYTLG
jgi:beta-glucanase (GH16 family)